jgi:Ca-activated chloride channel family protein
MKMNDEIIRITDEDLEAVTDLDLVLDGNNDRISMDPGLSSAQKPIATKEAVDIILCIDTSGSMEASDYHPNRLQAAKDAALMFTKRKVTQNYNDRVGVIGFGGNARLVHALDSDLDNVAASISKLSVTHSGTMIGYALQAAHQELAKSRTSKRAIILLSDGGDDYDTSNPVKVAGSQSGIKVFTIGMGTLKGAVVDLPTGKQNVVLNESLLRNIAKVSGAKYLYAPDVPELQKIYLELADY